MFRTVSSKLTVAAMGARFASSSGTSGKHDDKQQQGKQGDQAKGNSNSKQQHQVKGTAYESNAGKIPIIPDIPEGNPNAKGAQVDDTQHQPKSG
jgi:hypothetical protein